MSEPQLPHDRQRDTRRMKAVLVAVAAAAFAAAPLVAPFQGFDPDLFPIPQDNPPIQPAGYAFGIWGLIYLWLLVSSVFGLLARAGSTDWDAPRWPLIGSLVLGAAWLGVAQSSVFGAAVLILAMLALALVALFSTPSIDAWLLRAPVSLYAGWLTAATWVTVGLIGAGYGIGPGPQGWAVVSLIGALITAGLVQWSLARIPMYVAAVLWALAGIAVANIGEAPGLVALSIAGAAALATLAVWQAWRHA